MCLQSLCQKQDSNVTWSGLIFCLRIKEDDARAFPCFVVKVKWIIVLY